MTICAWCKKKLRNSPKGELSHGICKKCLRKQLRELEAKNKNKDQAGKVDGNR